MAFNRPPTVHEQLGQFLRMRREACDPGEYGLSGERRRTRGLRREEVAEMSGISTDWYARLEQGRQSSPSHSTVAALAQALRLTDVERRHLHALAGADRGREFSQETVPPELEALVHGMSTPAYITGVRKDLLCWNDAAVELFRDFSAIPASDRNMLWQMFTEPKLRTLFINWEEEARAMLESFRRDYDLWAHTQEFDTLVSALLENSSDFRKWWRQHAVTTKNVGVKEMAHPRLGRVKLRYASFRYADLPSLTLIIYTRVL